MFLFCVIVNGCQRNSDPMSMLSLTVQKLSTIQTWIITICFAMIITQQIENFVYTEMPRIHTANGTTTAFISSYKIHWSCCRTFLCVRACVCVCVSLSIMKWWYLCFNTLLRNNFHQTSFWIAFAPNAVCSEGTLNYEMRHSDSVLIQTLPFYADYISSIYEIFIFMHANLEDKKISWELKGKMYFSPPLEYTIWSCGVMITTE